MPVPINEATNGRSFIWENWSTKIFPGFYYTFMSCSTWLEDLAERDCCEIYYLEKEGKPVPDYLYRSLDDLIAREVDACPGFYKGFEYLVAREWSILLWEAVTDAGLGSIITSMEYYGVWSPQYYNYATDRLQLELTCDFDKLESWIHEHEDDFKKYLKECWTSRDGFLSHVPNTIEELRESRYYRDTCIEYLLRYVMLHEDDVDTYYDTIECSMYEYLSELSLGEISSAALFFADGDPRNETCESGEDNC